MDLILWRHAEANEGEEDLERDLTPRGERQAQRMSKWLDRQLPEGVKIFCSPARRAEQTVLPLGRKYKIRDELSPQGSCEHLLEMVQWPYAKHATLLVGHQPFLGQIAAQLLGMQAAEVSVRKGAVWWLRARQKDDQMQTILLAVQSPDMV
jgi:phosphohistidine phosphatase